MSEFYLNLPSNTNKALGAHRINSTSEFRVRLPNDIRLTGQWEVALVEIQCPYSWDNVPVTREKRLLTNQLAIVDKADQYQKLSLWPSYYDDIDHLMAGIEAVRTSQKSEMFKKAEFQIGYHRIFRRVEIKFTKGFQVLLSDHLAYMLGFKSPSLLGGSTMAQYAPDLRGGIDSLFIYCDIVASQVVGDSMQPLLRILPVSGKYGDVLHKIFVSPHYVDVLHKDFSSVSISIKTDRDLPVPFKFGKSIVKLHFRRKQLT